jgi:hypothetical protein
MGRIISKELAEAEKLLAELCSWSEEEIQELPRFYREKARELQKQVGEA